MSVAIQLETYNVDEAAKFLKMHPDTLQRKSAAGEIPSAKIGGKRVYVNLHLVNWLEAQYPEQRQVQQSAAGKEEKKWRSKDAKEVSGTLTSPHQTEDEYATVLELRTRRPRRNTMTA